MYKNAMKRRFIELRAQGLSFKSIADQIGVSKRTLIHWGSDVDIATEIDILKVIEYETLQENYGLLSKQRHEFVAKWLKQATEELEQRGLKNLSTSKLLSFIDQCDRHMRDTHQWLSIIGMVPKKYCRTDFENMMAEEKF